MDVSTYDARDREVSESKMNEVDNIDDLLRFKLGPGSSRAKTHLYSSTKIIRTGGIELTDYGMVSERETQLVVQEAGAKGIKSLYNHARELQNPAFLGWVVQADYFQRCNSNNLTLYKIGSTKGTSIENTEPVPFDSAELKLLHSYDDLPGMKDAVKNLIPTTANRPVTCKPEAWNQGAYDVVRIEMDSENMNTYHLRFGTVTKALTHSLKLHFFYEFISFLEFAGCNVGSVEIGFILPKHHLSTFRITPGQVVGSGLLGTTRVYGGGEKSLWSEGQEHTKVVAYGLDMSEMNYPEA